jgi:hypothetical protein
MTGRVSPSPRWMFYASVRPIIGRGEVVGVTRATGAAHRLARDGISGKAVIDQMLGRSSSFNAASTLSEALAAPITEFAPNLPSCQSSDLQNRTVGKLTDFLLA